MLEAKDIVKTYGVGKPALNGVSLRVEPGEFVCVTGRSGSGKSTLLNVMATLLRPDGGSLIYGKRDLLVLPERELDRLRRTDFAMIFQMHHLLPFLNVLENVCLPLMGGWRSVGRGELARAQACLDRVGLLDKGSRLPGELSGGEQQRVAIARALVSGPKVLFADEPTGSLDRDTGGEVMGLLRGLNSDGISVVMVTHELEYAAQGHRRVELTDGQKTAKKAA